MHAHYSRSNLHHLFMDKARGGQWLVTVHRSSFSFRSIAQPPLLPLLRFPRHIRARFLARRTRRARQHILALARENDTGNRLILLRARDNLLPPFLFHDRDSWPNSNRLWFAAPDPKDRPFVFHSFTTDDYSRSPWNITDVLRLIKIRCNWYTVGDNNLLK